MERADVHSAVVGALDTIQRRLNGSTITLADDDRPIGAIGRFDSLCGLEATVKIEARLGIPLPENIFVNDKGTRALKLYEVVDRVLSAILAGA